MKPVTLKKVQELISGDKLTAEELDWFRKKCGRLQESGSKELLNICYLRSGAKVGMQKIGSRYRYVVQGYAPDGSDLPKDEKEEELPPEYHCNYCDKRHEGMCPNPT